MGLHHNSFEYYYPVEDEYLEEETQIAKEQRSQFLQQTQ